MNLPPIRIVFITFEPITDQGPAGIGRLSYPLATHAFRSGYDVAYFVVNKWRGETTPFIKNVHWSSRYFLFALNTLYKHGLITPTLKRKAEEYYFDYFLTRNAIDGDYLIITTAFIPRALRKFARKFKSVSYIPPTPNELEIARICQAELNELGSEKVYHDPYTDPWRLKKFTQSLPFVSRILSHSSVTTASYASIGIQVVENHFVYAPAVRVDGIAPKRQGPVIFLYVAHSVLLKGLHRLLNEWDLANLQQAELHIVGRVDDLYRRAFDISASHHRGVLFHGHTTDVEAHYVKCDCVVIPSLIDGEPHVTTEALSRGRPVLISNGCGHAAFVRELVPAAVFDIMDIGCLARKMEEVARCPEQYAAKQQALFEFVRSQGVNYAGIYDRLLAEAVSG